MLATQYSQHISDDSIGSTSAIESGTQTRDDSGTQTKVQAKHKSNLRSRRCRRWRGCRMKQRHSTPTRNRCGVVEERPTQEHTARKGRLTSPT
jgi:hypothetical protein